MLLTKEATMIKEISVPEIGENVTSGTVVGILVQPGDPVAVDDPVIELETDKAVVEIPCPVKGRITEILVKEGQEVRINEVIARVETEAERADEAPQGQAAPAADVVPEAEAPKPMGLEAQRTAAEAAPPAAPAPPTPEAPQPASAQQASAEERPPAPTSPSVRRLSRELGVDIHHVSGSGPGGRISTADVKAHVHRAFKHAAAAPAPTAGSGIPQLPNFRRWGEIETLELPTVRRVTAQSTSTSWGTIPHVTQFDQADITAVESFIEQNASAVRAAGGKLTLTAILMKICALALARFQRFNASIDLPGRRLILKRYIHIGLAVDTPHGLLVPVIRDVDQKPITTLAAEIVEKAERARQRKLKPEEMEGGTFTLSNQGGIGGIAFTPIVLWPQVAILGVSRGSTQPVYIQGELQPRKILPLSLSYDHRVIDGADAARFVRFICEGLESPLTLWL
jgi:pyruvate dehydrogenase E2 component (dihydrolipoamide acetyltransferase)